MNKYLTYVIVLAALVGFSFPHLSQATIRNPIPVSVSTSIITGILGVTNGGTGTGTAFTEGSVIFATSTGIYDQSNTALFFNKNTGRLGLGTTAPPNVLSIVSPSDVSGIQIRRNGTAAGNTAILGFRISSSDASTNFAEIQAVRSNLPSSTDTQLRFNNTKSAVLSESMRIDTSGNLLIGTTTPIARLTVNAGDVYVSSSTRGIILMSPDGTCAQGLLSNIDVLTFSSITCP